jgi:hypothetical protein
VDATCVFDYLGAFALTGTQTMKSIAPLLILLLLLVAACGGGNEAAGNSSERYIPDISTADGAVDVYARAINKRNLSLAEMVVLEDEREEVLSKFRSNFTKSKKGGVVWKLEFKEARSTPTEWTSKVIYNGFKNGEPFEEPQKSWIVFIKTDDGWKYSQARTRELIELMKKRAKPPANSDEEPADGNSPPPGND